MPPLRAPTLALLAMLLIAISYLRWQGRVWI
jgi:hypothetical protein